MAARKLQSEIDRTLKKVGEGVELFEGIYDKMQSSTNQTQKEKLETDLKTQIKKLQRLRDQIKSWVASSDIKDKSVLLDNRKLIETQMEKFKACEKEMKTKAFSKEGLTAALKLDPKAQEKSDTISWLQTMVDDLGMQVESAEAEIETLQGGTKKKGKAGGAAERLEELEHLNERRKWHVSRLELILRLLENGSLQTDKVLAIKEDVKYFVESNTEEEFEEDEGIYEDLNLEEQEGRFGLAVDDGGSEDESVDASEDLPPRTPLKDVTTRKASHDDDSHRKEDMPSPVVRKAVANRKHSMAESSKPTLSFSQPPVPPVKPPVVPPARTAVLPLRYAAAAAGTATATPSLPSASAVSSVPTSTTNGTSSHPPIPSQVTPTANNTDVANGGPPSPSLTHPSLSAPSPILSSNSTSGLPPPSHASRITPPPESVSLSFDSNAASPVLSEAAPIATSSPHRPPQENGRLPVDSLGIIPPPGITREAEITHLPLSGQTERQQALQSDPSMQPSTHPGSLSHTPPPPPGIKPPIKLQDTELSPEALRQMQDREEATRPLVIQHEPSHRVPSEGSQHAMPSSLSDLLVSFDNAKQKAATRMSDLNHVHKLLEAGYSNIPQPSDTSKPKYYVPRHPFQTPSYYPQVPHAVLSNPAIFSRIDVETLFYVFYFLPGTYQQYLAAQELKKQSWRFHVKYLTWFQRHSEPQAITEEYEQGVYVYFDWEGSWCQRKKADFRFEYRYLSEE